MTQGEQIQGKQQRAQDTTLRDTTWQGFYRQYMLTNTRRYNENQASAFPQAPAHCLSLSIKTLCFTVSHAALRSTRISAEQSPASCPLKTVSTFKTRVKMCDLWRVWPLTCCTRLKDYYSDANKTSCKIYQQRHWYECWSHQESPI